MHLPLPRFGRFAPFFACFLLAIAPVVALGGHATGPFTVKMAPQPATAASPAGRYLLEKTYAGGMSGSATAEMLTADTGKPSSGAYVAIEKVNATLDGRAGSFQLVHRGTMQDGKFELLITVVPDSGTEALSGLTGRIEIQIGADGSHTYSFDYSLAAAN